MPQDEFPETVTLDDPHPAMDMATEGNEAELNEAEMETAAGGGIRDWVGSPNHNQTVVAEHEA